MNSKLLIFFFFKWKLGLDFEKAEIDYCTDFTKYDKSKQYYVQSFIFNANINKVMLHILI